MVVVTAMVEYSNYSTAVVAMVVEPM
jgi:hypothetical protein